ncbi:MAG: septum formation initiator family protein [Lachnospiraceae bacterium]
MGQRRYENSDYVYGSAAKQLKPQWEMPQEEINQPYLVESPETESRHKPKVGHGIDLISMILLVTAIVATLYVCIEYLQVQSDIVQLDKAINSLSTKITALDKENDALEAVLKTAECDLEYIYQIAVGTLGMVYPNHNEVIYYENNDTGYFRQYQDIPE